MLVRIRLLKSEEHHIIPQQRHGYLHASKFLYKTTKQGMQAPEKRKVKNSHKPEGVLQNPKKLVFAKNKPETFIVYWNTGRGCYDSQK